MTGALQPGVMGRDPCAAAGGTGAALQWTLSASSRHRCCRPSRRQRCPTGAALDSTPRLLAPRLGADAASPHMLSATPTGAGSMRGRAAAHRRRAPREAPTQRAAASLRSASTSLRWGRARARGARRSEMLADPAPNLSTTCGLSASLLAAPATSSGSPFWLSSTCARPPRAQASVGTGRWNGARWRPLFYHWNYSPFVCSTWKRRTTWCVVGKHSALLPPASAAGRRQGRACGGGRAAPDIREAGQRHAALHTAVRKAECATGQRAGKRRGARQGGAFGAEGARRTSHSSRISSRCSPASRHRVLNLLPSMTAACMSTADSAAQWVASSANAAGTIHWRPARCSAVRAAPRRSRLAK